MTEDEAVLLWPKIKDFKRKFGTEPSVNAPEAFEQRLAEALAFIRRQKAQQMYAASQNKA